VLYRQVGEVRGEANCIFNLGSVAHYLSKYDDARNHFEEVHTLYQKIGYVVGEANCLKSLGDIALELSSLQDARTRFDEALPLYQQWEIRLDKLIAFSAYERSLSGFRYMQTREFVLMKRRRCISKWEIRLERPFIFSI
jgi:tetratricopeptide (TPR) repeat protein